MARRLAAGLSSWLLLSLACSSAGAQGPELQFVFPSCGTAGSTVEVELIGKQVDTIDRLYFSCSGIEARLVGKGRAEIKISADARLGDCDVWAASSNGVSAPARFSVEESPVSIEKEPNNTAAEAQSVTLPAIVCGRIDPATDGDWYRVPLKIGDDL